MLQKNKLENKIHLVTCVIKISQQNIDHKRYRSIGTNYKLIDFQKLMGDISWLRSTIGLSTYELSNLFQKLQGGSNSKVQSQDVQQLKQKKGVNSYRSKTARGIRGSN